MRRLVAGGVSTLCLVILVAWLGVNCSSICVTTLKGFAFLFPLQAAKAAYAEGSYGVTNILAQQCTHSVQQPGSKLQQLVRLTRSRMSRSFAAASGPSRPFYQAPGSTARAGVKGSAPAGAKAAAAPPGSGDKAPSSFSRWWKSFQSAPTVPKVLGLAGAIPFIALAPPVAKHLVAVLPSEVVDNSAMIQVSLSGLQVVTRLTHCTQAAERSGCRSTCMLWCCDGSNVDRRE